MASARITISLDSKTARAYAAAGRVERRTLRALLSLWLRELAAERYVSLERLLDEVGHKAEARGMTAKKLELSALPKLRGIRTQSFSDL
jgi:hypothetical protein